MPPTSPTSSSGTPEDSDSEGQQQNRPDDQAYLQSMSRDTMIGAFSSFLILMTIYAFLTIDSRKVGAMKLSTTPPVEYDGENDHVRSIELT